VLVIVQAKTVSAGRPLLRANFSMLCQYYYPHCSAPLRVGAGRGASEVVCAVLLRICRVWKDSASCVARATLTIAILSATVTQKRVDGWSAHRSA
jgi:hypothetical protein